MIDAKELIPMNRYWLCSELVSAIFIKMYENKVDGNEIALFKDAVYNDYHRSGFKPIRFVNGVDDLDGYIPIKLSSLTSTELTFNQQ